MIYSDMPDPDTLPDTTYKSGGVHQNRDSSAKMQLESMDREGITESARQASLDAADAAANPAIEVDSAIMPDEPMIAKKNTDTGQDARASGHKSMDKFTQSVEAPAYKLPTPGSGTDDSFGNEGTQQNPAASGGGGGGMSMDMGSMMGGGEGGGEGGGGMSGGMSGMSNDLGNDIASIDDEIDRANNTLLYDDTDIEAHQAASEKLQGR